MKHLNKLLFITLFYSLSSCFCVRSNYTGSPEDLNVRNTDEQSCCLNEIDSKSATVDIYYGVLPLEEGECYTYLDNTGQVGLRAKYHLPMFKVPFKIANIGLDYSYMEYQSQFKCPTFITIFPEDRKEHRLMLDFSCATFARRNFVGYLGGQIGYQFRQTTQQTINSIDQYRSNELNFRVSYQLNYYFSRNFSIYANAGVGAGSHARIGLSYWIF